MRLPASVVATIRDVANHEDVELCFSDEKLNKVGVAPVEGLMQLTDFRPFSKFFHASSRKSATLFISGNGTFGEAAQKNTINMSKYSSSENHYKLVFHGTVSIMFRSAVFALHEEKKFLE